MPTATLYGFENGNTIRLLAVTCSYDCGLGILTILNGINKIKFDIGTDYDPALFRTLNDIIQYARPPPSAIPDKCLLCQVAAPVASTAVKPVVTSTSYLTSGYETTGFATGEL